MIVLNGTTGTVGRHGAHGLTSGLLPQADEFGPIYTLRL